MAPADAEHRTDPSAAPSPAASLFPDLQGQGLRLRPWDADSDADAEDWLRGVTDPEFQRWNTPLTLITDLDGSRALLCDRARQQAEGATASYCITDESSGTTLGHISVNAISHVFSNAHIGYWVLPEARGHGVATRALRLAAHWALTDLGLHRLDLGHALGHDASCHIAERCGFRYEGTLRGAMFEAGRHDAFRDNHLHGRLATDPDPGRP